jgi:hypothetical protein
MICLSTSEYQQSILLYLKQMNISVSYFFFYIENINRFVNVSFLTVVIINDEVLAFVDIVRAK